jgi:hypothetical protein
LRWRGTRASIPVVTDRAAPPVPVHSPGASDAAWTTVHARGDIEYVPLSPAPVQVSETPQWLQAISKWLVEHLAPLAAWLAQHLWLLGLVVLALVIALVVWIAWSLLMALVPRTRVNSEAAPEWRPDAAMASALLSDADQLAAAGHYDEAVHLLLRRSFDDIAATRPDWLTPASTAREIAGLGALPQAARSAFGVIAGLVERSRYALHPLGQPDWTTARAAYAGFAVPARGAA